MPDQKAGMILVTKFGIFLSERGLQVEMIASASWFSSAARKSNKAIARSSEQPRKNRSAFPDFEKGTPND